MYAEASFVHWKVDIVEKMFFFGVSQGNIEEVVGKEDVLVDLVYLFGEWFGIGGWKGC